MSKLTFIIILLALFISLGCSGSPPDLRPVFAGEMETVDERTGLYNSDNGSWLIVPALDSGWQQFSVGKWISPKRIPSIDAIDSSMQRAPEQLYRVIAVDTETDVDLAGWHFRPASPIGIGAVILHGSGDSDRSNSWYVYLANILAAEGIDVILPDKRGSGRSGGDWRNVSFLTLAEDGAAWFRLLRSLYPSARLGYVGISQGGFVAPIAAGISDADFVYAQSAAASTLNEQLRAEVSNDVRNSGVPNWLNSVVTSVYVRRAKGRRAQFWKQNGTFDITLAWRNWNGPMFIGYGELDEFDYVPVELSIRRLDACCKEAGLVWKVYLDVGHSLIPPESETFPAEVIDDMLSWIVESKSG